MKRNQDARKSGESSYGSRDGAPYQGGDGYKPKHDGRPAGSDLPPRGQGVKDIDLSKRGR